MGKYAELTIQESIEDLTKLLKKQTKGKIILKLNCLIHIKRNSFKTRQDLCDFLGINKRTQERWINKYKHGGLANYLSPTTRNTTAYKIPENVREGLRKCVHDSDVGFSSYVQAQQWVKDQYGVELQYNTIRQFLINKFKTKIKQPRKSHIKKKIGAEEAFLKTT